MFSLKVQHAFWRDTFQNFIIHVCKFGNVASENQPSPRTDQLPLTENDFLVLKSKKVAGTEESRLGRIIEKGESRLLRSQCSKVTGLH